jgi:pimeloyl-ACP methyl ester carboxylesterase
MVALLDHLRAGPTALCGLSLGGTVVQQMAIDWPDRAAAIIVANSRSSFSAPEHAAIVDNWIGLLRQDNGPLKRLRTTWPILVNERFRESSSGRAVFEAWARVLAAVPGSSFRHVAEGMTRFDIRGRLATIRVPALLGGAAFELQQQDHQHRFAIRADCA